MIDFDSWMLRLAKAAVESDEHNHVFVMREVLTEVYQRGFKDGHMAAWRDDFVKQQVERINAEHRTAIADELRRLRERP